MGKALLLSLIASVTVSTSAYADILSLTLGSEVKNGVKISTAGTATVDSKTYPLKTVGSGLRVKVVLGEVPVYVAQLLVSEGAYVKSDSGALPSLDNLKTVAMRLTFVRDVPADTMSSAFQAALDANNIPDRDADIVEFMKRVNNGGDAKRNGSMTIFITKNDDGSETLAYENTNGPAGDPRLLQGSRGLTHKIMSMWLGNVAHDPGLVKLKAELLR